jgi:hypothetical protein
MSPVKKRKSSGRRSEIADRGFRSFSSLKNAPGILTPWYGRGSRSENEVAVGQQRSVGVQKRQQRSVAQIQHGVLPDLLRVQSARPGADFRPH